MGVTNKDDDYDNGGDGDGNDDDDDGRPDCRTIHICDCHGIYSKTVTKQSWLVYSKSALEH